MPKAIDDIIAERARHLEREGWSTKHDDTHTNGELAQAAFCYAFAAALTDTKPKDRRRDLVRAAALIVAEIERLDRAAARG